MHRKLFLLAAVLFLGLQLWVREAHAQSGKPVAPGQDFSGGYINIKAPNADGWWLVRSSGAGMGFTKRGQEANESFGAQVLMFRLSPTDTPEEFEALIKASAAKDTDPSRFDVQEMLFKYSNERGYPCVRHSSVVKDKAPQGLKNPLLLESVGLYCRHPVRQETGFAIIYSHRGESLYANSRVEAESFIQSVQVPGQ